MDIYDAYFNTFCFVAQFPVMLLGIVFYHIRDWKEKVNNRRLLANTLLIVSLCMIWGMIINENNLLGFSDNTLFGIWFLILVFSQSLSSTFIIDNKVFRLLGKYSYPMYLFHYFIIRVYEKYVPNSSANIVVSWGQKYIAVLVTVLVVSIIISKYIEKPLVTKLNAVFNNML